MLKQLARLRGGSLLSGIRWGVVGIYGMLVGGLLWHHATESVPCLLTEGGMSAVGEPTWRWAPPVGWECDYSAYGAGSTEPGWFRTGLVLSVPLGAGTIVAGTYLADRVSGRRGAEEEVAV